MKRTSFQSGSVVLKPRKRGPDVWAFRYMEDGVQKSKILGTVQKFRTKASAQKEAAKVILEINERLAGIRVSGLCDRFEKASMEMRSRTMSTYLGFLKRVRADFGAMRVDQMVADIIGMETWINALETVPVEGSETRKARPAHPLSKRTKLHYKAFLHLLIELAMKWGLHPVQRNPASLIKVKGKPQRVRQITLLTGEQYRKLIADPDLEQHVRVMIQVAMLLGIRISEVLGLKWDAIDFKAAVVSIRVSVVGKNADDTKTLASEDELPMHEDLAAVLQAWKDENSGEDGTILSKNDWLFGNEATGRPFWGGTLQQDHLVPAGKKVGIQALGWHDFRHTYAAMMDDEGIDLDVRKKLMRHADIAMTLKYGQRKSNTEQTRTSNAKVVELLRKRA